MSIDRSDTNQNSEYNEIPFTASVAAKRRETVKARLMGEPVESEMPDLLRAAVGGLIGAMVGAVIYAAFVSVTGISMGFLAILVGYLVGKGMNIASGGLRGDNYQYIAVVLTYLSVAMAETALWWPRTSLTATSSTEALVTAAKYGLIFPLFSFYRSIYNGIIGGFILYVGLRAAWRMTSSNSIEAQNPFSSR